MVALGLAFGAGAEIRGSVVQLLLDVTGMTVAGWVTLALQQLVWTPKAPHRRDALGRSRT